MIKNKYPTKLINFVITLSLADRCAAYCTYKRITRTELLIRLLEKHLDEHEDMILRNSVIPKSETTRETENMYIDELAEICKHSDDKRSNLLKKLTTDKKGI